MADSIKLELITPSRVVVEAQVSEVQAPGFLGEFGVLPGHTVFLSLVRPGEVRFREGEKFRYFAIGTGMAEIGPDRAVILSDMADESTEIKVEQVREELAADEGRLKTPGLNPVETAELMGRIDRHRARLQVAARR
jgi:F-type H+-transporting ATPase subunit epsilon